MGAVKRAVSLVLVMLAVTASGADDVGAAARVLTREGEGRKAQWAPTRNFLRLNTRFVLGGESERRTSPYAGEGGKTAAGGFAFAWDVDGRLVSATTPQVGNNPGIQADYEYDGLGLRRSATVVVTPPIPGVVTTSTRTWTWGGADGEEEVAEDSNLTTHVAGFRVGDGPNSFTHDGLGSVVTQTAGMTVKSAEFSSWGTRTALSPPLASSAGFTGHRVEDALGLTYAQQRWLDTKTGTFLSRDPVGAGSYLMRPNDLYAFGYAAGNPTRFTDPDGRAPSAAEQCRALEQRGLADMASCMKGAIRPSRKRYFAPTSAAPAPVTEGPQAVVEGAAERAASIVIGPTELVVQAFGYDADFNVISPDQRQQAQAQLKELNDALRKRALFPALLVSDAFSGGGTAIAELGNAMANNDMRAAGGATFDVATQVPFLFEGGLGIGRSLTPSTSILAQPARSVLNPANWEINARVVLAAGPVPPLIIPQFKYSAPRPPLILPSKQLGTLELAGDWQSFKFATTDDHLVYILRDTQSGELLKVGSTITDLERFKPYARAGRRTGRDLSVDFMSFEESGFKAETVEAQIRQYMEGQGHALPWDNTSARLGRPGPGVPGAPIPKRLRNDLKWDYDQETLVPK